MVKITDRGAGKRAEQPGHGLLPGFVSHHRQSLETMVMPEGKPEVFPERPRTPAMEILHFQQNTDMPTGLGLDQPLDLG